ncbi:MAG: hypothetical protein IKR04_03080 [Clostridia bacterium]|nr:hypothetical protein [Clostridia bacterium]
MKKFFKVLLKIIMAIVLALFTITIFMISLNSEKIPDVSVTSTQSSAVLIRGNHNWKAFTQVLKENNFNYNFKSENTIIASPGETVTIEVSSQAGTRRVFEVKSINYFDSDGNQYISSSIPQENPIDSYSNRYVEQIIMPDKEDTYYYYIKLSYYEKGEVEYAFKVVVSTEPNYDIAELIKLKKTSLMDYEGIQNIINLLPYSKNITNVTIRSSSKPTRLVINYSEFIVDRNQYNNNVIALFALIPELDNVEYVSPDGYYYFTRDEMEFIQGRNLEEYTLDAELWENEVLYKEKVSNDEIKLSNAITNLIVNSLQLNSGDMIDIMSIDENSFNMLIEKDPSNIAMRKIYSELAHYAKNIINTDYNTYKSQNHSEPFIMLSEMSSFEYVSGDNTISEDDKLKNNLHNLDVLVVNGRKETKKKFELYTQNDQWIISEVD